MGKKFVKREDLGVIMETLAERALTHSDKVSLKMSFEGFCGDKTLMVHVKSAATFNTLLSERYTIIDKVYDDFDLSENVFDAGLAAWEKEDAKRKAAESAEIQSEEAAS